MMSSLLLLFVAIISLYLLHELLPYLENFLTKSNFEERGFKDRFEYEMVRKGGFDSVEEFNAAKRYNIPNYHAFEESYDFITKYGFPDYQAFKAKHTAFKKGGFHTYDQMRKAFVLRCDNRLDAYHVVRGGFKDCTQYELAKDMGIENVKQFDEAYYIMLDYGLSSYSEYQLYYRKIVTGGFDSLNNFLYARSKGFDTVYDQRNATKMGYSNMIMFEKALKYKIPNAVEYDKCIDDLKKYAYPDYNSYSTHHEILLSKGFSNFPTYMIANKLGYENSADYHRAKRGGFKSSEEYYMAYEKGFTRSDLFKFAIQYNFSSYLQYLEFISDRKSEISRIQNFHKRMQTKIRTPLTEIGEQLAIDKGTLVILLFDLISKNEGIGELHIHEGVYLKKNELFDDILDLTEKIGLISKLPVSFPMGICPHCNKGDSLDIIIGSIRERPICPNCRMGLNENLLMEVNKIGAVSKKMIKGSALMHSCGAIETTKIFTEIRRIRSCPVCDQPIKNLIRIKI